MQRNFSRFSRKLLLSNEEPFGAYLLFIALTQFSFSQSIVWSPTNGPYGGNITALATTSSGKIFAGSWGGGLFNSIDRGTAWTQSATFSRPIISLNCIDNTLFAGTVTGLLRSKDDGVHWTKCDSGLNSSFIRMIFKNSYGEYIAVGGGVFRSNDSASSWSSSDSGLTSINIRFFAAKSDSVFFVATYGGGIFRSNDAGLSWTSVNLGLTQLYVQTITAHPSGILVAGTISGVFRSSDNGETWSPSNNGLTYSYIQSAVADSAGTIYLGTARPIGGNGNGVFRSSDSGVTWTEFNSGMSNEPVYWLALTEDTILVAATNRGVFVSHINSSSWVQRNSGLSGSYNLSFAIAPGGTLFSGTTEGLYSSNNAGSQWNELGQMIGKEIQALLVKRSGLIFAGLYMNGVFRSSDNGGSWIKMNSGLTDSTVYCLAVNSLGTIFAGTYSGGVFHSTNEGDTWLQGMRIGAEYFSNVAVTKSDAVLTAASNGVYRSSDAGGTWAKVPFGALGQSATSFAADSSGFVYAGTNTGILRSSDDGISWVNLGSISSPIRSLTVSRQNHIFAGMLHGVYQSTDQGISWTLHQDGLPNSDVLCLAVDSSGFLFAATRIGIYKTVTPILTSVCRDLTFLPTSTFLGQNYPNPFNPSTQIEFQLARESRVSLRVFNVVGQEVALLVNKLMDAGTHQTTWNAIGFPAGVYFYRLTAGDFMQSKKMILLK